MTFRGPVIRRLTCPQRVEFETELEYQGRKQRLTIEVVIGCRVTTATRDDVGPWLRLVRK